LIEANTLVIAITMFCMLLLGIFIGYPVAWVLSGVAVLSGLLFWGPSCFDAFYHQAFGVFSNFILLAVPLFIFMGVMIERSGLGERLFSGAFHIVGLRKGGGLAVLVVLVGVVLAVCLGIMSGAVAMLAIVALPTLMRHNYNKELASGTCIASGCLGIFIPPSVLLVVYGPTANISVGKLFMAAFMPGLLLAALYSLYIVVRCNINPSLAPPPPADEKVLPLSKRLQLFVTGTIPVGALILSILGVIYFGIATPSEAAAIGCLVSMLIALVHRRLNFKVLKESTRRTLRMTGMIAFLIIGGAMFQTVFLGTGCTSLFVDAILAAPFGQWGSLVIMLFIVFILGFFLVDFAIILIMVPLVTPIGATLGFDPLWFAMLVCLTIQTGYMTPPYAGGIFFFKGSIDPSFGITTGHIIRGLIPFIFIILTTIGICIAFPQIITWLPSMM